MKRVNCKEASRLMSEDLDGRLSLYDRARLRLHLSLCDACTNVKAQFAFLRRALATYADRDDDRR
jgi:predicted anti-sigma-YlaC factor YlaD